MPPRSPPLPAARRTGARVVTREIRTTDDRAFDPAYRLLRRIFPRSEMLPRSDWVQVMRERTEGLWTDLAWHLLVAERGGRVVGAASGSYLGNVNIGLIGYIAVTPASRATGLGPRLRRHLRRLFERDAERVHGRALEAIVGEVRRDNPWLARLIAKDGAIALDFPYEQPDLEGGGSPVPLVLYYQPLGRRRTWVSAEQVRRLLYTIWRRSYRIPRPLKRPAFRRMLRALRGRGRIGSIPRPLGIG